MQAGEQTLCQLARSLNLRLRRRHPYQSQWAMVAERVATYSHGGDRSKGPIGPGANAAEAVMLLNVGERSVMRARKVRELCAPEHCATARSWCIAHLYKRAGGLLCLTGKERAHGPGIVAAFDSS